MNDEDETTTPWTIIKHLSLRAFSTTFRAPQQLSDQRPSAVLFITSLAERKVETGLALVNGTYLSL